MKRIVFLSILAALAVFAGCTGSEAASGKAVSFATGPDGLIVGVDYSRVQVDNQNRFEPDALRAVWVTPQIEGGKLTVSQADLDRYGLVFFETSVGTTRVPLLALKVGEKDYRVYPRICPPCRSESWHLKDGILVCGACGTTFKAVNGDGIEGACVDYPKAPIPYSLEGGKLYLAAPDVAKAYQATLRPGRP